MTHCCQIICCKLSLSRIMELKPGMRMLDMGCGKAMTSIFLAKEFGVTVFANDLWISPSDNWKRICEAGMQNLVIPIHGEDPAHNNEIMRWNRIVARRNYSHADDFRI